MITSRDKPLEWPAWVLMPLVIGYLTMTRSFAHIGFSPIYIGEAVLGMLMLFRPGVVFGTWLDSQFRYRTYSNLATLAGIFVLYGFLQCLWGLVGENDSAVVIQCFTFNIYIAFLFVGIWLGAQWPKLLSSAVWYLAWANAIYGIAYVAFLGGVQSLEEMRSGAVALFGQPAGSAVAILGLLAFERNYPRIAVPLLLNALVMLGVQVRAEWLGLTVAVVALSAMTGRMARLFQVGILISGLLFVGVIVDFKLPAPTTRGGVISSREIVGRAIAAVDERAGLQFTDQADSYAGTVKWRTDLWKNLLVVVHQDSVSTLFGKGYGYPIWLHNDFEQDVNRSPHNIFIFALAYTGWIGVLLFYSVQICLGWNLWKVFRASGQPFGFCLWILVLIWSHFDNKLESPAGAIPYYVLAGMALTSTTTSSFAPKSPLPIPSSD